MVRILGLVLLLLANSGLIGQDIYIDSLKQRLDLEISDRERALISIELSKYYLGKDLSQVKVYAEQVTHLLSQGDTLHIVAFDQLAKYYFFTSNLDSAHYYFSRAEKVAIDVDNKDYEAAMGLSIASVLIRQAKFEQALRKLIASTEYFESIDNQVSAAKGYSNMAACHANLKNYSQAIAYSNRALEVFRANDMDQFTLLTLPNLGTNYLQLGDTTRAIDIYLEAEGLALAQGNQRSLGVTYTNLAELFQRRKQYEKAKTYAQKSISNKKELGLLEGIDRSYNNLGYIYAQQGRHQEAISNFELALRTADNPSKIAIFNNLKDSYRALGKNSQALVYADQALAIKDSVRNEENAKSFAELSTRYETAKKENEILQLESNNQKLEITKNRNKAAFLGALGLLLGGGLLVFLYFKNQRRKRLIAEQEHEIEQNRLIEELNQKELNSIDRMIQGQEEERNRIAADLHDSLGSKMAALKLFVDELDVSHTDRSNISQVREIADYAYKEVRNISHLLNSGVLVKKGLIPAIKNAASFINDNKKINIDVIDLDLPDRIDRTKEIQLFRITQELLTNIVKHAVASEVLIQLSGDEDEISLSVEDNGVGISNVQKGIGLENIEKRVNEMGGVFDMDSVLGKGTSVMVRIPIT